MTIGQKIKQIRKEKSLSQQNVYPSNQSLVSQIEKGVNKNPTEQTLRIMADNMDMSFDELIEGTEWELPRNVTRKSEYAFSQTECVVTIDDSGEIITKMKSYPLKEDSGEENKFDPDTGYKLISECTNCKRAIQQLNQAHCFGCGVKLFNDYSWFQEIFTTYEYINYNNEIIPRGNINEFLDDMDGIDRREYLETLYTRNLEINYRITRSLSFLLDRLMKINALIDPDERYSKDRSYNKTTDPLLIGIVNEDYYFFFRRYYYTMTKEEIKAAKIETSHQKRWLEEVEKVIASGGDENITSFHPTQGNVHGIPIGAGIKPSDDTIDIYDGGYKLYDLININPNKIETKIIEKWWILFKHDLSMTKGLLNEMLRHQKRLLAIAETEGEKTNEKPNETEPNEEG